MPAPHTSQFTIVLSNTPSIIPSTATLFDVTASNIVNDTVTWISSLIPFGIIFAAAAIGLGTAFMVGSCCNSWEDCPCNCKKRIKHSPPTDKESRASGYAACLMLWILIGGLAAMLFFIASMMIFAEAQKLLTQTNDLQDFQNTALSDLNTFEASLNATQVSLGSLTSAIVYSNASDSNKADMLAGVVIANASLVEAGEQVDSVQASISSALHLDDAKSWISAVGFWAIGLGIGLFVLDAVVLLPSGLLTYNAATHCRTYRAFYDPIVPSAHRCNQATIILGYIFAFVMVLLGSGLFSTAQGTSQVCRIGPAAFVNETGLPQTMSDYLLCDASDPGSPMQPQIDDALVSIDQAQAVINEILTLSLDIGQPDIYQSALDVSGNITSMKTDLSQFSNSTSCAEFAAISDPVYKIACTNLTAILFSLYLARLVTMMVFPIVYYVVAIRPELAKNLSKKKKARESPLPGHSSSQEEHEEPEEDDEQIEGEGEREREERRRIINRVAGKGTGGGGETRYSHFYAPLRTDKFDE